VHTDVSPAAINEEISSQCRIVSWFVEAFESGFTQEVKNLFSDSGLQGLEHVYRKWILGV
jgi:hypothetical protein